MMGILHVLAIVLVAVPQVTGPRGATFTAPRDDVASVAGLYNGRYRCLQGLTNLTLDMRDIDIGGEGVFRFGGGRVPRGAYNFRLQALGADRYRLVPTRWISQPPGFTLVGATFSIRDGELSGDIDDPNCGYVSATLAENSPRMAAAAPPPETRSWGNGPLLKSTEAEMAKWRQERLAEEAKAKTLAASLPANKRNCGRTGTTTIDGKTYPDCWFDAERSGPAAQCLAKSVIEHEYDVAATERPSLTGLYIDRTPGYTTVRRDDVFKNSCGRVIQVTTLCLFAPKKETVSLRPGQTVQHSDACNYIAR